MFDVNLLRGEVVDLDASAIWRAAVEMARTIMTTTVREAVERQRECPYSCACIHSEIEHRREQAARDRVWGATYAIRFAIQERTRQEREQAEAVVAVGGARFMNSVDQVGDCLDCERPFTWHVLLDVGGILCPFGREYWTYARALVKYDPSVRYDAAILKMRDVARATRRG